MKVEIITTGTELLLGEILNTNVQYLSRKLNNIGFDVYITLRSEIIRSVCAQCWSRLCSAPISSLPAAAWGRRAVILPRRW